MVIGGSQDKNVLTIGTSASKTIGMGASKTIGMSASKTADRPVKQPIGGTFLSRS